MHYTGQAQKTVHLVSVPGNSTITWTWTDDKGGSGKGQYNNKINETSPGYSDLPMQALIPSPSQ